jgi:hypothetical protein
MPRYTLVLLLFAATVACRAESASDAPGEREFAALQARGAEVMGVDQYTSTHRFDKFPDGGRIELQRDADDAAGTQEIRAHLRRIATAFSEGDFSASARVHGVEPPGTEVMRARRDLISYTVSDMPRGAELRIRTGDGEAIAAIHRFMDFQRGDHRSGGADTSHRH